MATITVTAGGPEIEAGAYAVTLAKLEGPKTITPQSGPNAGLEVEILDWLFTVDEGLYAGTEIQGTTSMASGPRSKMYSWLTALMNGKAPAIGATFEAEDLIGFRAIATISKSEAGWPRIESLGAFPVAAPAVAPRPAVRPTVAARTAPVTSPGVGEPPF